MKNFIVEHGERLTALNLKEFKIRDEQLIELIKNCPNINHLSINSYFISDVAVAEVAKLTGLKTLDLSGCFDITRTGYEKFKGIMVIK